MTPTTITGASCPKCGRADATINAKHPVCSACQTAIRRQAAQQQERDYLARWLSTRVDARGFIEEDVMPRHTAGKLRLMKLVDEARRLGLDWVKPPEPLHFDTRLATLMKSYVSAGNKQQCRGRPAKVASIIPHPQEATLWASA